MAGQTSQFSARRSSITTHSATSIPSSKIPTSLPKRLLFPQLPPGSELPPLLACDDHELNTQLYEFLAFALRAFVNPWWSKITRYDKEFLPEIARLVAIVLRELEARLRAADLPTLLLRDIPNLIRQHYIDYRNAVTKVGTSYATGGSATLPQIFHKIQPHMAVYPDGRLDETYIRQAVEHIMKLCLPAADWKPEVERTITREIITKVALESIFQRLTQPWFIQKVILDLFGPSNHLQPKPPDPPRLRQSHERLTFQTIIVFLLSAVQTLSGLCLTAIALSQKALQTVRSINTSTTQSPDPQRVNLSRPLIDMTAEVLTMRSRASSSSILSLVELFIGLSSSFVDRALPNLLYGHLITVSRISQLVKQAKRTIFPDGYPAVTPPDPTPEEQLVLREALEMRLSNFFPGFSATLFLGPDASTRRKTVSNIIDPLSRPECNVHLLMLIFDATLLALFPEMEVGHADGGSFDYTRENRSYFPEI